MRQVLSGLMATFVIVAGNTGDTSCEGTGSSPDLVGACQVDTRGIEVERGLATDVFTVRCDVRPIKHTLKAWLEFRDGPGDDWVKRSPRKDATVPDAEGYSLLVDGGACVPGDWRAAWNAYGRSPDGIWFDVHDADFWPTTLTKDDCLGR